MCPIHDDDPLRVTATSRLREPGATEGVAPTAAAEGAEATAPADGVALEGVDAIAQELAAGEITPIEARERLVDLVVAAQLPAGLPPEEIAAIRDEVAATLFDDPVFEALLAGAGDR